MSQDLPTSTMMDAPDFDAPNVDMPSMDTPNMDSPNMDSPELGGTMPNSALEPVMNERRDGGEGAHYKRSIYALPVTMQVVIGSARPTIAELLQMKDGTLLTLGSKVDDPVDLCINNRVIARGELVETDPATGAIGVRLTEIVDISEDILNG